MKIRTRYAPSPTGKMHVGNLRSALYEFLIAKHDGGSFMLRIEDTDQERFVEGATEIIYRTMEKTGLIHDEGPDKDGGYGPYVQSERMQTGIYMKYAKELIDKGEAYYCFCDKERLATLKSEVVEGKEITIYDKHCLGLSKDEIQTNLDAGKPFVIRQNNPTEGTTTFHDELYGAITVQNSELDDMILIKSDGYPTYNFANVVDDHTMNITHVVRGNEYLSSSPKYVRLYDAFGWEVPVYVHLPLITDENHKKLSKRSGHSSFEDLLEQGFLTEAIVNYIALLGWSPKDNTEKFSLQEMVEKFDIAGLSHSPSIFDEVKMRYINSLYVKEMSEEDFHNYAIKFYDRYDYLKGYDYKLLSTLLHSRVEVFSDIGKLTEFLTQFDGYDLALLCNAKWKTNEELAKAMLPDLIELTNNNFEGLHDGLVAYAEKAGYKKGQVLWVFRIALTGAQNTPGGAVEMAQLLGKEKAVQRLQQTLARL